MSQMESVSSSLSTNLQNPLLASAPKPQNFKKGLVAFFMKPTTLSSLSFEEDLNFKELERIAAYTNGYDRDGHPACYHAYGIYRDKDITGIGVVIRNHRGIIERLYAGSLGFNDRRINELNAMFQGLIRAYWDGHDILKFETDNVAAEWEWTNSIIHGVPHEHAYVVQQLNQRKEDDNLSLVAGADPDSGSALVSCKVWSALFGGESIDTYSNELAMYLARHGAENYHQMVIIENLFGRVRKIWSNDMGLGPVEDRFLAVYKGYIADSVVNDVEEEIDASVVGVEEA
ncbi:hypothetical protein POM88_011872 [Heracleum sosnowskyi]|uniref:RNase H type-1 domain-containing protein n=1 Tax=Heracleum sosnowskyi TaxID=360622 RepID=A0AAD8IXW2_9APIA|nr:hypothetical protein POM88_011872 [Heracleum sosnowskyi]